MNHPNRSRKKNAPGRTPKPDEIRKARLLAGLSQAAAGKLLYSGVRTWQKWEYGERPMHPVFWEYWQIKSNSGDQAGARRRCNNG